MVVVRERMIEICVGIFMLIGFTALIILALKVSGLTSNFASSQGYMLSAKFDNVGGLKPRAAVKVAGVTIGEVRSIQLDTSSYQAVVNIAIYNNKDVLPVDSSASILTAGLLGANYIGLVPGFEDQLLQEGGVIETTHQALILENLIGQFLFGKKKD